jgi:hypothetical protein
MRRRRDPQHWWIEARRNSAAARRWRELMDKAIINAELIGCDLVWKRDGLDWVLFHKRRRMGRVTLDHKYSGMYRVVLSRGRHSDMANLSRAKDAALAAAIRELEWETNHPAINPPKCPVKESL